MPRLWPTTIKLLFATALAQSLARGCENSEASEIARDEMLSYLVETICPDGEEFELRITIAKCSQPPASPPGRQAENASSRLVNGAAPV